jgi:hypothetical protein
MAIKTPKWAKESKSYPTEKGWTVDRPKGRTEVIKAKKFSATEIAEWHAENGAEEHVIQTLHEAPVVEVEVEKPVYKFYSTFAGSSEQED